MHKSLLSLTLAGVLSLSMSSQAETVRMCTPPNYILTGISDNGEWALGLYGNEISDVYAFRWNLMTNEIELSDEVSMCGTSIANDGTYCGGFNYTEESGRTVVRPGYYDGKWHPLPLPEEGTVNDALDGSISPDGRHMALTVVLDGKYCGVQYTDGQLVRVLKSESDARVYDITDDGSRTCGWTYARVNGKTLNRTGVWWEGDSDYKIIDPDPEKPYNAPWAGVRKFSSDGNRVLYFGGWTSPASGFPYVTGIKDLTSGDITPIYAADAVGEDFQVDDFSDDNLVVGSYNYMASISEGDKTYYLVDWLLEKKGIDAKAEWPEVMTYENAFLLTRSTCIQHNGKAIGIQYNGTDYELHSMVVLFDVSLDDCAPVTVRVAEVTKALATRVDWVMPYGLSTDKIKGFNVYRDGVKINTDPVQESYLYDSGLEQGKTYSYQVTAIYDSGESEKSDATEITVIGDVPEMPTSLFARQKGLRSMSLSWDAPFTNLVRKYYFDDDHVTEGFGTSELNTTAEAAIKFTSEELALYGNSKVTAVEFYPMSLQQGWKVTLYSENAEGELTTLAQHKVANKDIKVGERNLFTLPTPVDIPEGENLLASVSVTVVDENTMQNAIGMQYGKVTKGYSDLLRREIIPPEDFQSLADMGAEAGLAMNVSWKIGVILTPEGTSDDIDVVDKYVLTRDGEEIYSGSGLASIDEDLEDGTYSYGVKAVYADGRQSEPAEVTGKIKMRDDAAYGVQNPTVSSETENTSVVWEAPVDADITDITWSFGEKSSTRITSSGNNYNLQAAAIYPESMLRGLDGYNLVGARFYPTCDATYTIIIDNGVKTGELVYHEVESYTPNEWNTVYFDEPIALDVNKQYRLIVDCYDVENNGSPLAVDNSKGVDGYSCLINVTTEAEQWQEVSATTGNSCNWMMGIVVADPEPRALPIKGYDVLLDGNRLNEAMITETSFSLPTAQLGAEEGTRHKIAVDTWYEPATVAVPGTPVEFVIGEAGIDATFVADMTVGNDGAVLRVTNAVMVSLYDLGGFEAASAAGDSVRIDNLASGIYIVKAHDADGKELVTKINIRRK